MTNFPLVDRRPSIELCLGRSTCASRCYFRPSRVMISPGDIVIPLSLGLFVLLKSNSFFLSLLQSLELACHVAHDAAVDFSTAELSFWVRLEH